jgi:hypothetical protein
MIMTLLLMAADKKSSYNPEAGLGKGTRMIKETVTPEKAGRIIPERDDGTMDEARGRPGIGRRHEENL